MNASFLVSVVIPAYNRAHLIAATLDSVLAQTYTNWECIIVDDGSKDDTAKVVGEYVKKDARFQYHERPKDRLPGGNAARNYGFEVCKGEYVIFYDSDDIMLKNKLECHLNLFESSKKEVVGAILNSCFYDFSKKNEIRPWREKLFSDQLFYDFIRLKAGWQTGDGMWDRKVLNKIKFDETLTSSQDWDFHLKCILNFNEFVFFDKYVSYIRWTPNSIKNTDTLDNKFSNYRARRNIILKISRNRKRYKREFNYLLKELYQFLEIFGFERKYNHAFDCIKTIFKVSLFNKAFLQLCWRLLFVYPFKIIRR